MKKDKIDFSKQGKQNRIKGRVFESKVRENLEKIDEWIVSKWMNTVDFDKDGKIGKIVPAKRKYNPFMKAMAIGTGFPDFVCFKRKNKSTYEVIGLEVKVNGYLDQKEKGMCFWLLKNKIFSKILLAKKGKKRGEIEYINIGEKYGIK